MKKKCTAHIECGRDGFYSVYSEEDFPFGFFGEGSTAEEAKADFINLFEAMSKDHFQRTGEMVEADFSFVYDASAFLQHYKGILTLSGLSSITGINKVQLSQYVCGRRHPSQKTQQKIKTSVIAFAEELSHALA
ncbi:MAG: DNA-binding protein [Bacteroidales bacterium]|nr:DNA-binding protein [Bacteroidales bacterium]